jgi:hypothetical protein
VGECTNYLWQDLFPKNACRAYEFAKLFEEPVLMDKCLQVSMNSFFMLAVTLFTCQFLGITEALFLGKALMVVYSSESITDDV